ncbi:MAG: Trk system potassium transport protein TrkA [Melioribacteraceae bacterium]|nr:MAG: Trk system potassium transport protein TrkA [Melioribacteraceae bacterium]
MKIILAGAGEVGYHLAKQLSNEAHDITVIDIDGENLERVNTSTDVLTIQGSATSITVLKDANISHTDLFIAVTSTEAININCAILAKELGAKRSIARVGNGEYISPEHREMFSKLGIDNLIYPEDLAAHEVVKLIERAGATDVLEFENGLISLIGVKLDKNISILRKPMRELAETLDSFKFRIVAIYRGMRTLVPSGDDILLPNDQIFVITTPEGIDEVIRVTGKADSKMENVMILGGGKIGRKAAKMLESRINIKLIESDKDKTQDLADYLHKSLVIQGDGRDIDLLAQESIIDMDGFIAVTNDAETNIISCLMAKHLGVSKTIALVDNIDYIPLTQTIGLDSLINKKLIAANNISRFIRKSNLVSLATLQGIDAEVFEYIAKPGSKVTRKSVKNLGFPKHAIIGGYVRDGKGYITEGETQIKDYDKVVVFALPGEINKVERYFE